MYICLFSLIVGLINTAILILFQNELGVGKILVIGAILSSYLIFFRKLNQLAFTDGSVASRERKAARFLTYLLLLLAVIGACVQVLEKYYF